MTRSKTIETASRSRGGAPDEIESEIERVGEDADQVDAGSENLGDQSVASGETRQDEGATGERERGTSEAASDGDAETSSEETQELPTDQQEPQWERSGGDEELAEDAVGE